jgi:hypothetical protein
MREECNLPEGSVLSGVDVRAGGTWLGINRTGRVAFLLVTTSPVTKVDAPDTFFLTGLTSQKNTKRMVLPGATSLPLFSRLLLRTPSKRPYMVLSLLMLNMQALIYSSWRRPPMAKTACRSTEYMLPTTVGEAPSLFGH